MTNTARRSLTAQIAEVEREIGQRRQVYGRMVAQRKMRQGEADEKVFLMECVLETLRWIEKHKDAIKAAVPTAERSAS